MVVHVVQFVFFILCGFLDLLRLFTLFLVDEVGVNWLNLMERVFGRFRMFGIVFFDFLR